MLRTYSIFNVAQVDGLTEVLAEPEALPELDRMAAVDAFVGATKAEIRTGGNQPMYVPSQDFIAMPAMGQFHNANNFYATLLHECAHWSGAERRLNRDLKHRFGTKAYAAEELIAELTAAFLCALLGIEGELRHAGYIADWIQLAARPSARREPSPSPAPAVSWRCGRRGVDDGVEDEAERTYTKSLRS